MKRMINTHIFICAFVLLVFSACSPLATDQEPSADNLVFNIRVNYDSDTKAVKTGWVTGDVVYAFFNNVELSDPPKYARLTFDGTNWMGSLQGGLTVSDLAASGKTMSAVFFPFGSVNITKTALTYKFTGDNGLPIYTYYLSATADYTVDKENGLATLSATLNMKIPEYYVQFFVDKSGEKYNNDFTYRLIAHDIRPTACLAYHPGTTDLFDEDQLDPGQPMWGYVYNDEGVAFSGKIYSIVSWKYVNPHRLVFFELGSPALTKVFTNKTMTSHASVKLKNVSSWERAVPEPKASFMGVYKDDKSSTNIKLYWADRNLGATSADCSSTDSYGFFFAWGEISPDKRNTDWDLNSPYPGETYWYWYWGHNNKYNSTYNSLEPQDDAAFAYLGDGWRMPTASELQGLKYRASISFVETDKSCKFTRSSSSVYFPSAGTRNQYTYDTNYGHYWTSTYPYYYTFHSASQTYERRSGTELSNKMFWRMPIRPIKEVASY